MVELLVNLSAILNLYKIFSKRIRKTLLLDKLMNILSRFLYWFTLIFWFNELQKKLETRLTIKLLTPNARKSFSKHFSVVVLYLFSISSRDAFKRNYLVLGYICITRGDSKVSWLLLFSSLLVTAYT